MSAASDEFELDRFVQAQLGTFDQAYVEIVSGKKRSPGYGMYSRKSKAWAAL